MGRFFFIASVFLSMFAGWCSVGLWMSTAHSIGAVEAPFRILASFDGDKNGPKYAEQIETMKNSAVVVMEKRNATTYRFAYIFAGLSVFQFFTIFLLANRLDSPSAPPRS